CQRQVEPIGVLVEHAQLRNSNGADDIKIHSKRAAEGLVAFFVGRVDVSDTRATRVRDDVDDIRVTPQFAAAGDRANFVEDLCTISQAGVMIRSRSYF